MSEPYAPAPKDPADMTPAELVVETSMALGAAKAFFPAKSADVHTRLAALLREMAARTMVGAPPPLANIDTRIETTKRDRAARRP